MDKLSLHAINGTPAIKVVKKIFFKRPTLYLNQRRILKYAYSILVYQAIFDVNSTLQLHWIMWQRKWSRFWIFLMLMTITNLQNHEKKNCWVCRWCGLFYVMQMDVLILETYWIDILRCFLRSRTLYN